MTSRAEQDAFAKLSEEELKTVVKVLESPTRRILLIAIASYDGDKNEAGNVVASGSVAHEVSDGTTRRDVHAYIAALERKLAFLKELLNG